MPTALTKLLRKLLNIGVEKILAALMFTEWIKFTKGICNVASKQRDLFDLPGAKQPGERQTDLEDIIHDLLSKDISTDWDAVDRAMAWHERYQDSSGAYHYKYK